MTGKIKTTLAIFVSLAIIGIGVGVVGAAYGLNGASQAEAGQNDNISVVWNWPPPASGDTQVSGATATVQRDSNGVWYSMNTTGLNPGVHTMWIVVFNNPAGCEGGCGGDDLMGGRGDSAAFWAPGTIVGTSGEGNFGGFVPAYYMPAGPDQVLKDNTSGQGLTDVENAEIHLVLRTHGDAQQAPMLLTTQMGTFNGGCNPDPESCQNVQYSIHKVEND